MERSREENIARLRSKAYDVLVIGGGITGTCIARDAALRGLRVACVDKKDWAFGTSSRSSKLIHGGIRYLEMFDFKLVFEACRERRQLLLNAPHLVYPQAFTFPIYRGDKNGLFMIESGLILYDMLALFRNVKSHRMYLHDSAMELEPEMDAGRLKAAGVFYDCSTDDARLTLAFMLSALDAGADCVNYMEVENLLKNKGKLCGARVRDVFTAREFDLEARVVVNAAGAWGDMICGLDEPGMPEKLRLTKGSHILVPRGRARTRNALPITSPEDDRLMFVIPRGHFTLIGTTDIYYNEDLDRPFATREEVEYMLEAANRAMPRSHLDKADVISTYSGLRPLAMQEGGRDVAESQVSREHRIYEGHSGLLTIAGGKLTTGRSMAEEMVDLVSRRLSELHGVETSSGCRTRDNPVLGTPSPQNQARVRALANKLKFDGDVLAGLLKQGSDALDVLAMAGDDESLARRLSPEIPYIEAQVRFAVSAEMARTVNDFLVRRTEIYYTDAAQGLSVAVKVADIMGDMLGWDADERGRQVKTYEDTVALSRRYSQ